MKKIILKNPAKKEEKTKGGKAFYTILFVAIVTVGTTAHIMRTRNEAINKLSETQQPQVASTVPEQIPLFVGTVPEAEIDQDAAPADAAEPVTVSEELWQSDDVLPVTEDSFDEPAAEVAAPVTDLAMPVIGNVLKKHSDTELAYSKTMEDWRLHKGVDISSPIGETVRASARGTVSECYTDTACGVTIVIDHGSGLLTRYSNLASTEMVDPGQEVEEGAAIGVIGDTAEFEIADEAHLHFEVIKDGRSVDPKEYLRE